LAIMPFSIDQRCTRGNNQHNDQLSVKPELFVYLYTGELYGDKSGQSALCPPITRFWLSAADRWPIGSHIGPELAERAVAHAAPAQARGAAAASRDHSPLPARAMPRPR